MVKQRIIAAILLLLFVMSLAGCSFRGCVPIEREEPTESTRAKATLATREPTEEATEAVTEVPTETQPQASDTPSVDIGVTDGNTYTNESLGITCTFPDEWYVYNETDLASLNNVVGTILDKAEIEKAVENSQAVIIYCASEPVSTSSVNITLVKQALPVFDEDTVINMAIPEIETQLAQTGVMNDLSCTASKLNFCGKEHTVISVSGNAYGLSLYETILYLYHDGYLFTITASSYQTDTTAELLGQFEAIK